MTNANDSLRTPIKVKSSKIEISHQHKILTIGSCFASRIGKIMADHKLDVMVNPCGTVFNPISIFDLLSVGGIDEDLFVTTNGVVLHHGYHSEFRASDKQTLLALIKEKKKMVANWIEKVDFIFITLGSAWVYEQKNTLKIVSNCHKVPQRQFNKRLLTLEEMKASYNVLKKQLENQHPLVKLIFTVSPVRHIKDGLEENNLSKSLLRVFCHNLVKTNEVIYFPVYEMMVDDLRDYRFYKDDMIHPTSLAEKYIWQKFMQTFMSETTQSIIEKWKRITNKLAHQPFNPHTLQHKQFLRLLLNDIQRLSININVTAEIQRLEKKLSRW